jgi:hypothetical protein
VPPPLSSHPLLRSTPVDERDKAASLGLAFAFIAGSGVLLGALQIIGAAVRGDDLWPVWLFTIAFWVWIAAGLSVWWLRPANRIGPLLVGGGGAVFLGGLGNVGGASLTVVGAVFATAVLAVAIHLLLAYPEGRVRGLLPGITVGLAFIVAVGLQFVRIAVPGDLIEPFVVLTLIQRWAGLVVLLLAGVVVVRRLIRSTSRERRGLIPVYVYGFLIVILVPLIPTILAPLDVPSPAVGTIQVVLSTTIPVFFLVGVLRGRAAPEAS